MMAKKKINRGFKAKIKSISAPVGGLNARDSIANMPESDAIILDNWFPSTTNITVRNGYTSWNTKPTGWVECLMAYNGASTQTLWSADSNGNIREVTNSGTGTSAAVSSLTNGRFQYVNVSTPGGHYISAVNGSDAPLLYDGSTWTNPSITGVTAANLISVNLFKNRLFYTEKNTSKVWYLPLNSISGAAISIDFGQIFRLGGYLMGMTTWSVDMQQGIQDYAVFVSSEGEVLVYQGYDPAYASTWALVAQFRIGRPVGRRFYTKVGGDVVMITLDGAITLSKGLLSDRSASSTAISYKITNSITNDTGTYKANFGWQVCLFPLNNKLIINVPMTENSRQYQYVMNTISNAWCTFGQVTTASAWNAACFEVFQDNLYFGGSAAVYKADIGNSDNGANIVATCKPAFNYFGSKGIQKIFTMINPYFQSASQIFAYIGLNVDFQDLTPTALVPVTGNGGTSPWNTSAWNITAWSRGNTISHIWQTVTGMGTCASTKVVVSTQQQVSLNAIDYVYQPGGIL